MCTIIISILCYEHYNIYYACRVTEKVRLGEPNLRAGSVLKIQATATIAYGGLLFPPERGEHGPPFPLAQVETVSDYGIRLNAGDETGAGLDFVDQASVVIAHVIDSATDRSRN